MKDTKKKSEEACIFLKGDCAGRLRPSLGVGAVHRMGILRGAVLRSIRPNTTLLGTTVAPDFLLLLL